MDSTFSGMQTGSEDEFLIAYILWGGIILGGVLVSSALILVGYAMRNKLKIHEAMKIIYNRYKYGKEKNGRGEI